MNKLFFRLTGRDLSFIIPPQMHRESDFFTSFYRTKENREATKLERESVSLTYNVQYTALIYV